MSIDVGLFFCPFPPYPSHISLLKKNNMAEITTIRRNLALKEVQSIRRNLALKDYEIKETPDGKQSTFSIRFVKKKWRTGLYPTCHGFRASVQWKR